MLHDEALWKHLAAGAVAGAVSRTATAPLDRLKVFLQVRGTEFASISYCFKQLLQEGGWKSLWRGNGINVVKIAPETAIKFMAYEQAKRKIRGDSEQELNMRQRFLAGAFAGVFSQSVIYPMEVLKTRLVLGRTGDHRGIWDCAKKILRKEGVRSFYRGYLPNLIGIIPYAGVDLAVYETLKRAYLKSHINDEHRKLPKNEAQIHILLICGAISSSCGQLLSYPLALVRTRLQAATCCDNSVSMSILFRQIYDKEGLRGFYRGIVPNFMKVAPAVSISYVVYERTRRALGAEMC
uniref:Calcium-binding mitochondrial carrier protein SCaMC-1 n=1 Tax=Aceria tosichella TaxID=561515 RepID=A0A6G1SC43_9ACAR